MTNVIGLHGREIEENGANTHVVALLEHWLAKARTGELQAVGVLAVCRDGHVYTKGEGAGHRHTLVACCEYLKHDLCGDS